VTENTLTEFDATDFRIMNALVEDGRMSDVMLGERVHLSATAAARRRKLLEEQGAIKGYTAELDLPMLGLGIVVIVAIELRSQADSVLTEFEEADFLMMVHVKSFEDYDRIYRSELATLPHVAKIRSSFVMRRVTQRNVPPAVFARGK